VTTRTRRKPVGTVTFVGAGPGDPGLLTVRAVEALASADTVVLDRFAREQLLVHARPDVVVLDGATDPEGAPLAQATRSRLPRPVTRSSASWMATRRPSTGWPRRPRRA
jgi:uroporphyrinogen III methyltransferase/synthase